ncbi:hypothetical protein R6Q59_029917 [Mikania micrantha]
MCQPGSTTNVYTDQIKGTFGYMDAEYFSTRRLTRKSDVYAYGVVLLEVLCGRPALDFTLDEQQHSLAGWARQCIKEGKIDQIIDPSLRGQVESNCLKEFGQIAYECVLNSSKDRPTMTKVQLEMGKIHFETKWWVGSTVSPPKTNLEIAYEVMCIRPDDWDGFLNSHPTLRFPRGMRIGGGYSGGHALREASHCNCREENQMLWRRLFDCGFTT